LQLKHGVSSLVDIDFFVVDIHFLRTNDFDRFADDADFVFVNQNHGITDLYGNFLACGQRDVSTCIEPDVHTGVETHHQADAMHFCADDIGHPACTDVQHIACTNVGHLTDADIVHTVQADGFLSVAADTADKAGNLIQSADQRSGVLNYVYDKIGRIQEARNSQTGRSETFAFDPAHNILSDKAAEGKGKGSNISSGNRLESYNGIEYTYDALGNLIYRQLPDGENQYYQYDLENQLVRAEIKKPAGNTEIWEYAYDPFGRRLSKERQDKLAWTSTDPKRTHFVWDGSRLLQEYTYKGSYTYIYTDQDSYEPLAQVFHNNQDEAQYLAYFHTDQIGIPREMTDIHGNLLWYGEYTAWGRLKKDGRVYKNAHQPFRLQNQYYDEETGLHYNLMRYYEPEAGRFVNQDPIGLFGGYNLYQFAPNAQGWVDWLGLHSDPDLLNRINKVAAAMSEGDRSRTTYALARVTTSSGRSEIWIASAGKKGWVSRALQRIAGSDEVINNVHRSNKNHLNDAERKLMREARKRGAKIESIGATRPMCGRCQKGARSMGILRRVITALKR